MSRIILFITAFRTWDIKHGKLWSVFWVAYDSVLIIIRKLVYSIERERGRERERERERERKEDKREGGLGVV